jgi:large subunit ribosomal protein L29
MQAHDLAMLTGDELAARLGDSRRELFNLRFQLATGQLDNPSRIGLVRRDVARMLTVLRSREILEAEGAYVAPTVAQHEAAQAKLAAEDAAVAERAEARRAAAETEAADDEGDGDHDHDGLDVHDVIEDDDVDDVDDVNDVDDVDEEDDVDDEEEEA